MAKTMKKLLSLAIALVMVLSLIPAVSAEEAKTVTITAANGTEHVSNEAGWFEVDSAAELNAWLFNAVNKKYVLAHATEPITAKIILTDDLEANALWKIGTRYVAEGEPALDPLPHNITIDLNGHTITEKGDEAIRAFYVDGGNLTLMNGTIRYRGDTGNGGILFTSNGTVTLRNMTVERIKTTAASSQKGGVMRAYNSTVLIENCTFTGGEGRTGYGGVLSAEGSNVQLRNSTLTNGFATYGGNIAVVGGSLTVDNCTISKGHAVYYGGNIYAESSAQITMKNSIVTEGASSRIEGYTSNHARGSNLYGDNAHYTIYGGEITDGGKDGGYNKVYDVNGVAIYVRNKGTFHMYGGLIRQNDVTTVNGTGGLLSSAVTIHEGSVQVKQLASKYNIDNYLAACATCSAKSEDGTYTVTAGDKTAGTPVAATCTESAYTPYTCVVCATTYEADFGEATGHTVQIVPGKAATCTATGLTDGKICADCGVILAGQVSIAATGHTEETVSGKAATCTEDGLTDGKKCTVCGVITVEQTTIDALGHTPGEAVKENEVAGNCTTDTTYENVVYCTVCNAEISRETVTSEAAGHTEETIEGTAATCTEAGLTDGKKCSVCGVILVEQEEIKALGHTYGAVVTAPTCDAAGYTTYTCSVCGDSYTADEVTATGHTEETVEGYAATCTETGLTEGKKCSVCGVILVEQEEIKALGHTEETITGTAATCTATGLTEGKKCSVCGDTLVAQEEIPALEHDMDEGVYTEATFDADAYTTYTCKYGCGHTEVTTHEGTMLTAVAQNGETLYTDLEEALNQGGTVKLLTDVALEKALRINKDVEVTLDLGGKTLTSYAVNDNYDVVVNGALTIEGEGQIVVNGTYGIGVAASGKLTVNGGTFTAGAKNDYVIGVWGQLDITGGTFDGVYNCVNNFEGNVTISGGDFTTDETDWSDEYESADLLGENILVSGGTFSKEVAEEYLAEGLICVQTADGYEVREPKELTITEQPAAQEKKAGETFAISVEAQGDGELTYLWLYKKSADGKWSYWANPAVDMTGIESVATMSRNGYQFKCVITDTFGHSATTNVVTLTVEEDTSSITLEKCEATTAAPAGEKVTFKATETQVEGLKYQWLYQREGNGSWYYWTNESVYFIEVEATFARDGYSFKCVITDENGNSATWGKTTLKFVQQEIQAAALENQKVAVGAEFTLKAGEQDQNLTYLWLYKKSAEGRWMYWANPTKGLNQITVTAKAYMNGYQFRCQISDGFGSAVNTDVITVTVQ